MSLKSDVIATFKKEIKNYFFSATAFVYITLFLFAVGAFTFYIGDFIELNQANLIPFFAYHVYIYLLFLPALAMKLWSDERKSGTIELLLTLPMSTRGLVIGKFLSSWVFMGISLVATFPIWITINILGSPDNTVIFFSYIGSFLVAGGFLAICGFISANTDNQIISFILGSSVCFVFLIMSGFPLVTDPLSKIFPAYFVQLLTNFSALTHYENFIKGYFELGAVIYIISVISFWVYLTELRVDSFREQGK